MTNPRRLKVLILSTREWFGSARLPHALVRSGFEVSSLSFPEALVTKAQDVAARFVLPDGASDAELLATIRDTLAGYAPDVVVPGDDPAVELLHALATQLGAESSQGAVLDCLRRSLGDPAHYAAVQSRRGLHQLAVELGVRVPAQGVISNLVEAQAFAARHGLPVVLKAENSCAGFGTSICKEESALVAAFTYFDARFGARGQGKSVLTAQRFIEGRTAMRAIVAWQGEVLGGLSALKLETHPAPTGPSTVVEFFENEEMTGAVANLTRAFGISGFASFDFIVEAESDAAHLIELNPRPTPICHLGGAFGDDLCGALQRRLGGAPPAASPVRDARRRVALFPQEWIRNPGSPQLAELFHDVPWQDPGLVRALVTNALEQLGWRRMWTEEGRRAGVRKLFANESALSQEGSES